MDVERYKEMLSTATKASMVFAVLEDRRWHCRSHEYGHVGTTQLAGSGGIQGLERGSGARPGIAIESKNLMCRVCDKITRHDRWSGAIVQPVGMSAMSDELKYRVLNCLKYKDVVEQQRRAQDELTVDHKFPIIRWPEGYGDIDREDLSEEQIKARFQLLKASNGSASHNLLKSRACEDCFKTNKRGRPFGIRYFYAGSDNWVGDPQDEHGCHGCGWYDFDKWRKALNQTLGNR